MDLDTLCRKAEERAVELRNENLEAWLDEVRGYLSVGAYLSKTIDFENRRTIRKAQNALARMEAHLDRVMVLQHDAKRFLQIIAAVEYNLIGFMVKSGELSPKATGPAQQLALLSRTPKLTKVKLQWETLEQVCTQAQRRIKSARESIKQQSQLDDNLRWAQYRNPG